MNNLKIKGSLNEVTGRFKQKFAKLTNNELLLKRGREEVFFGRRLKKLGKIKDDVHMMFKKISRARLN